MPIRYWPAAERPREKLLERGPQALSDAELLAVLLGNGRPGCDAVGLARDLLGRFGGLRGLLAAGQRPLAATPGIGPARLALLRALPELGRRHLHEDMRRGQSLTSPADTRAFLTATLRDLPHEVFGCLFLDNRHRVIAWEGLFTGTIDGASVYPREVVRRALARNAAAVILAHNHPSGVAEPSQADIALTRRLREALALIDVRVLDHFVVGDGQAASLCERGML